MLKKKVIGTEIKTHSDRCFGTNREEDMAIRIEQNLFYVESRGLSLILENRDGYLMLKHLGRPIQSYHFPIPCMKGSCFLWKSNT